VIVVSDSTILIGLAKIGQLYLLKEVFHKIYVPEEVFREVTERGLNKPGEYDNPLSQPPHLLLTPYSPWDRFSPRRRIVPLRAGGQPVGL
jgi:hypothetical protein